MRLRAALALTLLACSFAPERAGAQPAPAEIDASKKAAAELANKALDAFRDGRYEDAILGFRQAEEKFHAPKFLLYLARAHVKLGNFAMAKIAYETILKERLATYAPAEFFNAQADAKKELAEILPKAQQGASPEPSTSPSSMPVATASAAPSVSSSSAPKPSGTAEAEPNPPSSGPPTFTYVAYSVGAAGLVAGAVFGGLSLTGYNEFNANPTRDGFNRTRAFQLVTDIGFGTAVAGAAAGTLYWLFSGPKRERPAPTKARVFVVPVAGSTGFGASLSASF